MLKITINNGTILSGVETATGFIEKLMGLMGRKFSLDYPGMMLFDCIAIHTFFMKSTIDVAYLSDEFIVLDVECIKPWRLGSIVSGTKHILEMPEGKCNLKKGDFLVIEYID